MALMPSKGPRRCNWPSPATVICTRRGCEKMGLAPSGNGETPGKSAVAKVPVPIFSQPRSAARGESLSTASRGIPAKLCCDELRKASARKACSSPSSARISPWISANSWSIDGLGAGAKCAAGAISAVGERRCASRAACRVCRRRRSWTSESSRSECGNGCRCGGDSAGPCTMAITFAVSRV
jgi:hypothetical protein